MAEIPAFVDRPTVTEGSLAWAGVAAVPAALPAEPSGGGDKGKGKAAKGSGRCRGG